MCTVNLIKFVFYLKTSENAYSTVNSLYCSCTRFCKQPPQDFEKKLLQLELIANDIGTVFGREPSANGTFLPPEIGMNRMLQVGSECPPACLNFLYFISSYDSQHCTYPCLYCAFYRTFELSR